jgi:hypothetical protein
MKSAGVKDEEIAWLGLDDFLDSPTPITRADLETHVRANEVRVEEVVKGDDINLFDEVAPEQPERLLELQTELDELDDIIRDAPVHSKERNAAIEQRDRAQLESRPLNDEWARLHNDWSTRKTQANEGLSTKFGPDSNSNLNLPGGENYRELLLTLPEQTPSREVKLRASPVPVDGNYRVFDVDTGRLVSTITADSAEDAVQRTRDSGQALFNVAETSKVNFTGGHYDEPNVLAHIRFNEREIDGQRVLFIEEMQSDWHAKGRERGYRQQVSELPPDYRLDTSDPRGAVVYHPDGTVVATANSADRVVEMAISRINKHGVPDAPLKKNWHEMAFRRMVRWAAENDFDRIAWTTGKQQADRYDLSKHMDRLTYTSGGKVLRGYKGDELIISHHISDEGKLPDLIGKDAAEKLLSQKEADVRFGNDPTDIALGRQLTGQDLKIGGESLKRFYDNMLPNYARKFGKKFDAEVGDVDIDTPRPLNDRGDGTVLDEVPEGYLIRDGDLDGEILAGPMTMDEVDLWVERNAQEVPSEAVHSMTISPKMKDVALNKGFPLFSRGPAALGLFPTGREEQE